MGFTVKLLKKEKVCFLNFPSPTSTLKPERLDHSFLFKDDTGHIKGKKEDSSFLPLSANDCREKEKSR